MRTDQPHYELRHSQHSRCEAQLFVGLSEPGRRKEALQLSVYERLWQDGGNTCHKRWWGLKVEEVYSGPSSLVPDKALEADDGSHKLLDSNRFGKRQA